MIPRIIHQIWFQGIEKLPKKYEYFQSTWKTQAEFEYKFWDEGSIKLLISSREEDEWKKTYESFNTMIQKIDFAKYIILYVYGGIYIDMDAIAVNDTSLIEYFKKKFTVDKHNEEREFIVFRHNSPWVTIFANQCMGLKSFTLINNAVICSVPTYKVIESVLNDSCYATKQLKNKVFAKHMQCLVTTGPVVFTNSIKKWNEWKEYVDICYIFEPYSTLELTILIDKWMKLEEENKMERLKEILLENCDNNVVGIHIMDLTWFKHGKNNWKFKAFKYMYGIFV